ncbi:unnamed protein product, partial [Ectocarpus fasciculatus]
DGGIPRGYAGAGEARRRGGAGGRDARPVHHGHGRRVPEGHQDGWVARHVIPHGNDPAVVPHREDGGARGPDVPDAAHAVRQPDPLAQHPAEPRQPHLPRH